MEEVLVSQSLETSTIPTLIGDLQVVALDEGICMIEFADSRYLPRRLQRINRLFKGRGQQNADRWLQALRQQMSLYLDGNLTTFDIPLVLGGTPFQMGVWSALQQTHYGETLTYADLAARAGNPAAIRAAAAANGANPCSLVVPCHRVIGKRGELTGYGGGTDRKNWLLNLEHPVGEFRAQ